MTIRNIKPNCILSKLIVCSVILLLFTLLVSLACAETLIYEDDDVWIAGEIIDNGSRFLLKAQNKCDIEMYVGLSAMSVKNCSLDVHGSTMHITGGKKSSEKYSLSDAANYGISKIDTLRVNIWYHKDPNDYTTSKYFYVDIPNDGVTSDFEFVPEGKVCYEDDRICAYLVCHSDKYADMEMVYFNKSDIVINAYLTDTAFDDDMITSWRFIFYAEDIMPGSYRKAMETAGYVDDELREKGLEHIKTISSKMRFQEAQGGGRNFDSDEFVITISDFLENEEK